jgi:hypothetical protein
MDDGCLEVFLEELSKRYSDHHLLLVLDGAPSHRSEQIEHPENISLLRLPPRSPELDPSEAREMVSGVQAKLVQQDVRERRSNTRGAHPYSYALLGRARTSQTAHRLLMVGKGGAGGSMTSIDRNGISSTCVTLLEEFVAAHR